MPKHAWREIVGLPKVSFGPLGKNKFVVQWKLASLKNQFQITRAVLNISVRWIPTVIAI